MGILFKIVPFFIGFVFVLIVCWWIIVGVVVVKSANTIQHEGLKSVINQIWEGDKK